ncbi:long-chain fatty acid--CoA ligase [Capnocytophaga sp. G2]|jgi:long-chain-fatty-acid--coA ligase family protein|uniref:AMP-dependent synthetase/ligase n=1 Tax=Capnocytophaga sp. G2 TaxID=3110695 RepID=UPI002B4A4651|nr:long-chain fatty acid--CoA ligase [Capnocytophaga sp. G2]MEB3004289.1 long-chain fatty acid--CoA ligase [Capnocytophaga sp. G2]
MKEVTRLFDIPYYQLEKYPIENALVTKYNDKWSAISSKDYVEKINQVSRALLYLGVKPKDKIAVVSSNNRTEWHILDIAIMQIGAHNIPIYPTIPKEDYIYIFNHAEVKYCFVSDKDLLEKIRNIVPEVPSLKEIFTFDNIENVRGWSKILSIGENTENQNEVEAIKAQIQPTDMATIIYTSGTTGKPKGVMLSHDNIISNIKNCHARVPVKAGDVCLSFLPVCHIFERMLTYLYQYNGIRLYFAESFDKVALNISEVKPHLITVVPRVVEKVYDNIYNKGVALSGIAKSLFFWALKLGYQYKPYGKNGWWYGLKLKIARKLIFSKWKKALGGNLQMICGSAALQPRLVRVFSAAGIPIWEGYGLTETSPVISVNCKKGNLWKIGTIGKPIDNIEVKIAEDGEILCKGSNVMLGYFKNEEQTHNAIDKEGFFHTGDIGFLDEDGYLTITDRKKEMFKTSGGKYIAPQYIENKLKQSRFIEQAMVVGEGEKMPGAFLQPDFSFIREWLKRHGNTQNFSNAELVKDKRVRERIAQEIEHINKKLGKWEQVKVFDLTPDEWSIDAGHLTPTLKLKRRIILEKYKDIYNTFYNKESQS